MTLTTWIAIACFAFGTIAIVRGALIVALGGEGRFRGDPAASLVAGFALVLAGQWLLEQV